MELAHELQKIGLSDKEARVYLANLGLGQSSVQNIARKAGVNRATTYVVLESLIKQGLCSTFSQKKKTYYVANDPELLTTLFKIQKKEIDEKEKYFASLLPQFKMIDSQSADKPTVKFFEGKQGLLNCMDEFVLSFNRGADSGDHAYLMYNRDLVDNLFTDQEKAQFRHFRVKHELPVKSIYSMEKGFMKDTADGVRIKISGKDFPMSAEIGIHNEAVRFLIFGKKPSAIMIKNADVAKTLSSLFRLAWEAAERKGQKAAKREK